MVLFCIVSFVLKAVGVKAQCEPAVVVMLAGLTLDACRALCEIFESHFPSSNSRNSASQHKHGT